MRAAYKAVAGLTELVADALHPSRCDFQLIAPATPVLMVPTITFNP